MPLQRPEGALLLEANDEWQIERRYFSQESMRKLFHPRSDQHLDQLEQAEVVTDAKGTPRLAPIR